MDNLIPTTARGDNPLVLLAGTPPKPGDPCEAFTRFRADALGAEPGESDVLYVEFSADDDADCHDREQWAKANPSYPRHTKARAILRLLKTLGPASFRREALGIWDAVSRVEPAIDPDEWAALLGADPGGDQVAYGVRFSADGAHVAVAVATPADESVFVEVIATHSGSTSSGIASLTAWLAERARECDAIVIDGKAGAGSLNEALLDAGVSHRKIIRPTFDEVITCSANLVEMARERTVTHSGQPGLQAAVADAKRRTIGTQGGWGFGPISEDGDVTPLEAVALAVHGLGGRRRNGRKSGQRGRMVAG